MAELARALDKFLKPPARPALKPQPRPVPRPAPAPTLPPTRRRRPWIAVAGFGALVLLLGVVLYVVTDRVRPVEPPRELTNLIGMKLVRIEPGEFLMGSTDAQIEQIVKLFLVTNRTWYDDEKPQHRVEITKPFYLGIHEVTVGQFRRFVEETNYRTDAEKDSAGGRGWNEAKGQFESGSQYTWRNPGFAQTDDHPVVNVSHNDAVAFCEWLSGKDGRTYRLPTEAEWEYACRAGTRGVWGESDDPESLARIANVADATVKRKYPDWTCIKGDDGFLYTAPVGSFAPNAFGLYDMIGNVWEWCADGYDASYYASSPAADPPGPSGVSGRVIRGGGWINDPQSCRPAYRGRSTPTLRNGNLGFRVAAVQ
ncbi:formylglycine-generating enzyme family protein [soil metagenome]